MTCIMSSRVIRAGAVAVLVTAGLVAGVVVFAGQAGAQAGAAAAGQPGGQPGGQAGAPPSAQTARNLAASPSAKTYATYCAGCHGSTLSGGRAPTLLDDEWRFGSTDEQLRQSISEGRPGTEMQPFKSVLNETEIADMIGYVRALAVRARTSAARAQRPAGQIIASKEHAFKLEVVAEGLTSPWAIAFLPDGRLLVTERSGALRTIEKGVLQPKAIEGTPAVWTQQDGGLFDVEADPMYARNGWIYLSYSEAGPNDSSMTVIIRGRIDKGKWIDQQVLYRAPASGYWASNTHYGSRFIFDPQGHLFYSIGDRGREAEAQDLSTPNGKVHRINADGSVPRDNPFVGPFANRAGAQASIWSYGHRNPQGLAFHPVTGRLWEAEHGPTGGDEVNRIEPGHNYGWPLVHSGMPPAPPPASPPTSSATATLDPPIVHWTPSIAPSGITFYTGDRFPKWKNHLFVTGLGGEALRRLETDGDKVVQQEVVFSGYGRVRDVVTGPDGYLYVALNVPGVRLSDTTPGLIVRLVPADPASAPSSARP
jgi:aldose sugar dehydrogenase